MYHCKGTSDYKTLENHNFIIFKMFGFSVERLPTRHIFTEHILLCSLVTDFVICHKEGEGLVFKDETPLSYLLTPSPQSRSDISKSHQPCFHFKYFKIFSLQMDIIGIIYN